MKWFNRKKKYKEFNLLKYKCGECGKIIPINVYALFALKNDEYCSCKEPTNFELIIERIKYPL